MNTVQDSRKYLGFDLSELHLPVLGTPFYTVEEYEAAMSTGGSYEEILRREEARWRGFGFVYMHTLAQTIASEMEESTWRRVQATILSQMPDLSGYDPSEAHTSFRSSDVLSIDSLVTGLDTIHNRIRQRLDVTMQQYIVKRNGLIDCWPEQIANMRPIEHREDIYAHSDDMIRIFHYFALPFEQLIKKGGKGTPVYRNEYSFAADPSVDGDYRKLVRQVRDLEQTPQPERSLCLKSHRKLFITSCKLLTLLIWTVLLLLQQWFGVRLSPLSDRLFASVGAHGPLSCLMLIPALFIGIPTSLYSILDEIGPLFFGAAILLAGVWIFHLYEDLIYRLHDDSLIPLTVYFKGKRASEQVDALRNSPQFKQAEQESKQCETWQKQLAETWHRAWFEAWNLYLCESDINQF